MPKKEMTFFFLESITFFFDKQRVEDPISRSYIYTILMMSKENIKKVLNILRHLVYEYDRSAIVCSFDLIKHHMTYNSIKSPIMY